MKAKTPAVLTMVLILAFCGCATHRPDVSWPEARPLGEEFAVYRPPEKPSTGSATTVEIAEPMGVITLGQALAQALMQNPRLAAFSWEVRAREANTLQAGLIPNPELDVEVENFGGTGVFGGFDEAETTVVLSQLIELGGKRSKRKQVASLETDLAGWDYEMMRLDVFADTSKAFVDALAAQDRLALNEELVQLAEEVLDAVSERVKAGKVSPIEETKARVSLATYQIERERALRQLTAARKGLAAAWGSTSPKLERVEGKLDVFPSIPSAEALFDRVSNSPEIARWVIEIENRRASLDREESLGVPDVTLSGGVRRHNPTDDTAFVMGLSVPIPVFDRNQGGTLEARYRLAKAEQERQASRVRVRTALARAYAELSTAFAEATSLKNDVLPGARSAFEAASEAFQQGKFGYLDVLDAQRTLFETTAHYIEALTSFHKAAADVELLVGVPLDAIENPA